MTSSGVLICISAFGCQCYLACGSIRRLSTGGVLYLAKTEFSRISSADMFAGFSRHFLFSLAVAGRFVGWSSPFFNCFLVSWRFTILLPIILQFIRLALAVQDLIALSFQERAACRVRMGLVLRDTATQSHLWVLKNGADPSVNIRLLWP